MENQTEIEHLLPKYFEGKTTSCENEQIEAWMNEDEGHVRIVSQLNMLYLAADTHRLAGDINTDKAWNKVKEKTRKRRLSQWEWIQRVAAILSIPLLISVLALYFEKPEIPVAQTIEIKTKTGMTTSVVLPGQHCGTPQFRILPALSHPVCRRHTPGGTDRRGVFRGKPPSGKAIHRFHPLPLLHRSVWHLFQRRGLQGAGPDINHAGRRKHWVPLPGPRGKRPGNNLDASS